MNVTFRLMEDGKVREDYATDDAVVITHWATSLAESAPTRILIQGHGLPFIRPPDSEEDGVELRLRPGDDWIDTYERLGKMLAFIESQTTSD